MTLRAANCAREIAWVASCNTLRGEQGARTWQCVGSGCEKLRGRHGVSAREGSEMWHFARRTECVSCVDSGL